MAQWSGNVNTNKLEDYELNYVYSWPAERIYSLKEDSAVRSYQYENIFSTVSQNGSNIVTA